MLCGIERSCKSFIVVDVKPAAPPPTPQYLVHWIIRHRSHWADAQYWMLDCSSLYRSNTTRSSWKYTSRLQQYCGALLMGPTKRRRHLHKIRQQSRFCRDQVDYAHCRRLSRLQLVLIHRLHLQRRPNSVEATLSESRTTHLL
jgi:hypothetical protein